MNNLLSEYKLQVEWEAMLRMMGYPAVAKVSEPVQRVCHEQLARLDLFAEPWGSWSEVGIECVEAEQVMLEGGKILAGKRVANILRGATALKMIIVTLGAGFADEVRRLTHQGAMIEALALDAAGTVAMDALMASLCERLCSEAVSRGCGTTIRYGPGYTGWDINDISVRFSYIKNQKLPLRLNEQMMMIPEKSLLCIVGLTPGGKLAPQVEPCRICDLRHCSVRREPYRGTD